MSKTFSNKFVADEKNLAFLKETMWGPNGIRQAEELFSKAEGIEIIELSEMTCHDVAWDEYITSLDPSGGEEWAEDKWTIDMKAAEDGKYFNTIQLIAKVI